MRLSAATIAALASQCAPNVAPPTVVAIVRTESGGNPFALHVNGAGQPAPQSNAVDAATIAKRYVAAGHSVDVGLGQINSRNMGRLGLAWSTIFDPCTNIAALGQVITQNYQSVANGRNPQVALRIALSLYNSGSPSRGFQNGYVTKVIANAGVVDTSDMGIPQIIRPLTGGESLQRVILDEKSVHPAPAELLRPPPMWNVFERAAYERTSATQFTSEEGTSIWSN